jgi:thioesterase domain-containing protein
MVNEGLKRHVFKLVDDQELVSGELPLQRTFSSRASRAAFANKVHFVVIHYPPWHETIGKGGGFDTMVDAALAQICEQSDDDTYCLAGYSFGGIVAYEVARRLVESGGRIGFLGLIDARFGGRPPRPHEEPLAKTLRRAMRIIAEPQHKLKALPRRLIAALSSISAFRSLIAIGQLAKALPPKIAFELNWHLTAHVRMKTLRRWRPQPHDVSAVLFRSDEEWTPSDYGWGALCRQLAVITVTGSHLSLFNPPNRDVLCVKFLEALAQLPSP